MIQYCPHCHGRTDFIDTVTTHCPNCLPRESRAAAQLVSVQTTEGMKAILRGKDLVEHA